MARHARPTWTGTISFGMVALPVKLFGATRPQNVRFHDLQRATGERIRHRRVAEGSREEVPYEDIVKGYEATRGEYVVVQPDGLEAIDPGQRRTVEIEDFIELGAVDPVYFGKSYHVMPADEGAARAYRLLHQAMAESRRVAVGRFVMRGKQHLAGVRPGSTGSTLVLETMFFADEVVDPLGVDEADLVGQGSGPSERELRAALHLVDSSPWTGIRNGTGTPIARRSWSWCNARLRARTSSPGRPRSPRRSPISWRRSNAASSRPAASGPSAEGSPASRPDLANGPSAGAGPARTTAP